MKPLIKNFKLSVVIPAYNEINTIEEIIQRVQAAPYNKEIIVVDDGSTDGTSEFLRILHSKNIRILFHDKNRGKGSALKTGINVATGDVILIQDADLEYDPENYPVLLDPIIKNRADVVYGSRFQGGPKRVLLFWHSVGNKLLTTISNMFSNLNLTDMESCSKVFRREIIQDIKLRSKSFGFEPEITAKVARMKCRIYEVPISYYGRDYSEGKKIGMKDAFIALYWIIRSSLFG